MIVLVVALLPISLHVDDVNALHIVHWLLIRLSVHTVMFCTVTLLVQILPVGDLVVLGLLVMIVGCARLWIERNISSLLRPIHELVTSIVVVVLGC